MLGRFPALSYAILGLAAVIIAFQVVYVSVTTNVVWAVLVLLAAIVVMARIAKLRQPPPVA